MQHIGKVLESISYETVNPQGEETLRLHRVASAEGIVEFVVLDNKTYPPHLHEKADAKLHILSGRGTIILNNRKAAYGPGDCFDVPRATWHGFEIEEKTIMLSIQSSPILDLKNGKIDIRYKSDEKK